VYVHHSAWQKAALKWRIFETYHNWGILLQFVATLRDKKEVAIHMKTYVHLWNWLLQWEHTVTPVTYKTRAEKTN